MTPATLLQTMIFPLFAANAINIGADLGAMGGCVDAADRRLRGKGAVISG
jgi:hypothetical protein